MQQINRRKEWERNIYTALVGNMLINIKETCMQNERWVPNRMQQATL